MKKFVQEKPHIAGLIVFFFAVFVIAFLSLPSFFGKRAIEQKDRILVNKDGKEWTLPQGIYEFSVASADENAIKFIKGEIDPPDVHLGDMQTFMIEVSAESGIKSVKAVITTDTKTQEVALNNEGSNIWRGSWIVEDTHDTRYTTRFVAEDNAGNSDFFDIAWSDACGIALSGNWSMTTNNAGASCTISGVDGVDNGNVAIDANATLTVNGTFVWNAGKSITLSNGGKIVLGSGGSIQQGDLYMSDADSDGYPSNSTQYTSSAGGRVRKSALTSFNIDCNDGSATVWQYLSGYADNDGDGYNSPSQSSICSGTSLPAGNTSPGSDCNDSDYWTYQDWGGYLDNDGDGVYGSNYGYLCGGSSNPGVSASPGSDCDDYNYSVSSYRTCYTDNDTDGYTVGSGSSYCATSCPYHTTYPSLGTDCDDTSAGVWRIVQKYLDSDHDGYGAGSLQPFCIGYDGGAWDCITTGWCSNNNSDCASSDASKWRNGTFYPDADGDGYGGKATLSYPYSDAATSVCYGNSAPSGYTTDSRDCNDGNAGANYGNCISGSFSGGSAPVGGTVSGGFTHTRSDLSGDPVSYPLTVSSISGLPSGTTCYNFPNCGPSSYYVAAGGTASHPVDFIIPAGATPGTYNLSVTMSVSNIGFTGSSESQTYNTTLTVTPSYTYYRDVDGDGYGNPSVSTTSASPTPPAGYVVNNSDCYDSNANARPGQASSFSTNRGDGSFDYNCDGAITSSAGTQYAPGSLFYAWYRMPGGSTCYSGSNVGCTAGSQIFPCGDVGQTTVCQIGTDFRVFTSAVECTAFVNYSGNISGSIGGTYLCK
ncbi:hypothetical protein C4565_07555 [Candidatus Parcubacteria bacterium]|jgi:hypothetical protein|nr:MAG: hypothetical protein C4565_07555 [Candidatus Parcubacteria bacterium]